MKSVLKLISISAVAASLSPMAVAMSASECIATQKELSVEHRALSKAYKELSKKGESAELINDELVAAKEESSISPQSAERAKILQVEFNEMKAEIGKLNSELSQRSEAFNAAQKTFSAECSRYLARN